MLQGQRDEGGVDESQAVKDAQDLYDVSVVVEIQDQSQISTVSITIVCDI